MAFLERHWEGSMILLIQIQLKSQQKQMSAWIKESQVVKNMADRLLNPKHANYQEDYIRFKVIESPTIICHNHFVRNDKQERLKTTIFHSHGIEPTCCVVYLHGYGSHRVEGASLISALPKELALCCFDFSGSGKSEGGISAYGLKEYEDIEPILDMLKEKYSFKKFILWGRSMGAVASLLFNSHHHRSDVVFQVLDSPFSSFQKIAIHHARDVIQFPNVFIDIGLKIMKQSMEEHPYNPFRINAIEEAKEQQVPALFVYCEEDKVIPAQNSFEIIEEFGKKTMYERLIIKENHNNLRGQETLSKIFEIAKKYWIGEGRKQKVKYRKGINLMNLHSPQQSRNIRQIMKLSGCNLRSVSTSKNSKLMGRSNFRNPEDSSISKVFCFHTCSKIQE